MGDLISLYHEIKCQQFFKYHAPRVLFLQNSISRIYLLIIIFSIKSQNHEIQSHEC